MVPKCLKVSELAPEAGKSDLGPATAMSEKKDGDSPGALGSV